MAIGARHVSEPHDVLVPAFPFRLSLLKKLHKLRPMPLRPFPQPGDIRRQSLFLSPRKRPFRTIHIHCSKSHTSGPISHHLGTQFKHHLVQQTGLLYAGTRTDCTRKVLFELQTISTSAVRYHTRVGGIGGLGRAGGDTDRRFIDDALITEQDQSRFLVKSGVLSLRRSGRVAFHPCQAKIVISSTTCSVLLPGLDTAWPAV